MNYADKERRAVCPDCGCVAFKKSQHASQCPRGSDPTGAKLDRAMGRTVDLLTRLQRSVKSKRASRISPTAEGT